MPLVAASPTMLSAHLCSPSRSITMDTRSSIACGTTGTRDRQRVRGAKAGGRKAAQDDRGRRRGHERGRGLERRQQNGRQQHLVECRAVAAFCGVLHTLRILYYAYSLENNKYFSSYGYTRPTCSLHSSPMRSRAA
jgi:hypothetical protein